MKKILFLILFIFLTSPSWAATTWYVRDGGGTSTQCTGTTNAVYSSGTGQPCAFSHPAWVMGAGSSVAGTNGPASWSGGDTMYVSGDSDTSPGSQAQYLIGYSMPNGGSLCDSNTVYSYTCVLLDIPAGTDSSHRTTIIGTGTHQPQFYGTQGIRYILSSINGNNDVENIEITQHDSCTSVAVSDSDADGFPAYCGNTSGSYPFGPWAKYGLQLKGTNITTKNMWVHRISFDDIYFSGTVTNWDSSNDRFTGSGEALDNGVSNMAFGGSNTMTNDLWAFGGCLEHYPTTNTANVVDPANYVHCADQNNSGLGGGFMQQADSGACGNWTISYSQFLFNLKTNIDFLHCSGSGTFNFYRSRSEGSSGEALKINGMATVNIEESQLIGNAPVWTTSPFTAIANNLPIICRGGNGVVFAGNAGETVTFLNSDVTGNCIDLIGISVIGADPSYACTGMTINAKNSMFLGGFSYSNANNVDLLYNSGDDGNGSGACGTGTVPFNQDYNSVYNTYDNGQGKCSDGAHNVCSDPKVVFEATTAITSILGNTAYYSGTTLGDGLYLQSSSPLRAVSTTSGVSYTNGTSNDFNNVTAASPPDIGAVKYNSCVPQSNFCILDSECCGGTCTANACGSGGGGGGGSGAGNVLGGSITFKGITFK